MEFGRSTTRFICFELKNSVLMFVLWFASVWKKIFFHWPLAKSLNQGSTAGGRSGVTHPDRGARSAATWIPGGQPPQGLSNVMKHIVIQQYSLHCTLFTLILYPRIVVLRKGWRCRHRRTEAAAWLFVLFHGDPTLRRPCPESSCTAFVGFSWSSCRRWGVLWFSRRHIRSWWGRWGRRMGGWACWRSRWACDGIPRGRCWYGLPSCRRSTCWVGTASLLPSCPSHTLWVRSGRWTAGCLEPAPRRRWGSRRLECTAGPAASWRTCESRRRACRLRGITLH